MSLAIVILPCVLFFTFAAATFSFPLFCYEQIDFTPRQEARESIPKPAFEIMREIRPIRCEYRIKDLVREKAASGQNSASAAVPRALAG
jgi:hypothetical protein